MIDWSNPTIAAVLGGLAGGGLTALGVLISIHHDNKKEDLKEAREVEAFCKALGSEIDGCITRFISSIGNSISRTPENAALQSTEFNADESYFAIFDSAANNVGRIKSAKLRTDIIKTYLNMKGLLDSVRLYTRKMKAYQDGRAGISKEWLIDYTLELKQSQENLLIIANQTQHDLDAYKHH